MVPASHELLFVAHFFAFFLLFAPPAFRTVLHVCVPSIDTAAFTFGAKS